MKIIKLLGILVFFTQITYCQSSKDLVIAKNIKINSAVLGEERTVYISTPPNYSNSKDSYPVLYVLDGWTGVIGLANNLSDYGIIPELIVVVIEQVNPGRDLFPSQPKYMRGFHPVKPWYNNKEESELVLAPKCEICGQADKYLSFIETELIPFIDNNYRTLPYRICSGHSMGALCVTHAFLSHTNLFNSYIALSPPLYWDDGFLLRTAEEKLLGKNLKYRQIYFSIGEKEDPSTIADAHSFANILNVKVPIDLKWKLDYQQNEDHGSGAINGIINGLRFIYDGWRYDIDKMKAGGTAVIDNFYKNLTERYGYEISPDVDTFNSIGWGILMDGNQNDAFKIFEENTRRHPSSSSAYRYLAEGYLKVDNIDMAIKTYEKALVLSTNAKDENMEFIKQRLESIKVNKK
jgi:predicted alpha/beta superfamily hydrolase